MWVFSLVLSIHVNISKCTARDRERAVRISLYGFNAVGPYEIRFGRSHRYPVSTTSARSLRALAGRFRAANLILSSGSTVAGRRCRRRAAGKFRVRVSGIPGVAVSGPDRRRFPRRFCVLTALAVSVRSGVSSARTAIVQNK